MDKWRPQLDSPRQLCPETTIQAVLIVVENGGAVQEDEQVRWNFSPSGFGDVLACISATNGAMDKQMVQADSVH